jgi:hypothetical protein
MNGWFRAWLGGMLPACRRLCHCATTGCSECYACIYSVPPLAQVLAMFWADSANHNGCVMGRLQYTESHHASMMGLLLTVVSGSQGARCDA